MTIQILQKAEQHFRAGRKQDAIVVLEKHMQIEPADHKVATVLGKIYRSVNQPEKAAYWLRIALRRSRHVVSAEEERKIEEFDELGTDELEYIEASAGFQPELDFDHDFGVVDQQPSPSTIEASENTDIQGTFEQEQELIEAEEPLSDGSDVVDLSNEIMTELEHECVTSELIGFGSSEDLEENFPVVDDEVDSFGLRAIASGEASDYDWEEYALDDDLLDSNDKYEVEELPNRISPLRKARQVAEAVALEAGWEVDDLEALIEILVHHNCHGKTRSALKALIVDWDVTPEELAVLHEVRFFWESSGYNRTFRGNEACEGRPSASWRLCLRLVRQLQAESLEEVIIFVEDCFQNWCDSPSMVLAYPIFSLYLDYVINHMAQVGDICGQRMPPFIDYDLFPDEESYYDTWRIKETEFRFGYSIISPEQGW